MTTRPFTLSQQVFADGDEPVKKPLDGIFVDPAKEQAVSWNHSPFALIWQWCVGRALVQTLWTLILSQRWRQ